MSEALMLLEKIADLIGNLLMPHPQHTHSFWPYPDPDTEIHDPGVPDAKPPTQLSLLPVTRQSTTPSTSSYTTQYAHRWESAGGVVLLGLQPNEIDYIYVIKPSGSYGPWTFPKGRKDDQDTLEVTALREVREESGILAKYLPGGYLGAFNGLSSLSHLYMMVGAGGSIVDHDYETETVICIHIDEAIKLFDKVNNTRDLLVAKAAKGYISDLKDRLLSQ